MSTDRENAPKVMEQSAASSPQYWTMQVGKEVRFIILDNENLTMFDVVPARASLVLEQISLGTITKDWFSQNIALGVQGLTYKSIPLNRVFQVRLLLNGITVSYRDDSGKDLSKRIDCQKDEISNAVIESLQNRLGSGFTRITKANSRQEVAVRSLIMLLITLGITGFCYWGSLDLMGAEVHGRGSGIAAIMQLLGPNGVLCISGGLVILVLLIIVAQFVKPPTETLLVRKDSVIPSS